MTSDTTYRRILVYFRFCLRLFLLGYSSRLLQRDWSLSCDHGLDRASCENSNNNNFVPVVSCLMVVVVVVVVLT